jgi:hypothetical protein
MSKQPTPKLDALRAMREANYANRNRSAKPIEKLREDIARVPVKKPRKKTK